MAKYALHYAGDTFPLTAEEAEEIRQAIELVAENNLIVARLVDLQRDGPRGGAVHRFLFTPGVPIYLAEEPDGG